MINFSRYSIIIFNIILLFLITDRFHLDNLGDHCNSSVVNPEIHQCRGEDN